MITTFYPPHHFGGDAIYVEGLSRALARRGHEVHVIYDRDSFDLLNSGSTNRGEPISSEGVHLHALKSRAGWLSPLATQQTGQPFLKEQKIRAILDEFPPDVTHFHNVSLVGGPGVLKLGRGAKLYTTHEHWLVCPMHVLWKFDREPCETRDCFSCQIRGKRPPQWWRSSDLVRRSLANIDLFLSPSQFTLKRHTQWGGLDVPFEVLPYFCNLPRDGAKPSSPTDPDSRPYFLCVGRLEKIKGFHEVIAAFARYHDAELHIAGEGEYGEELRRLAAHNPRVKFLGRRSHDELGKLYRGAIATIFSSICYETFGMVIAESLAHHTPVIVNRIGAQNELVTESRGGLSYSGETEFLEAIRKMQHEPALRERLAETGNAHFLKHWSEDAHLDRYLEIIGRLRERSPSQ